MSLDGPIVAEDIEQTEWLNVDHRRAHAAEGTRSMLALPLRYGERVVGTLVVYYREPRTFSEAEKNTASLLANLAAAAIGTAELYQAQRRLAEDQRFVARASELLASSLDYETTLAEPRDARGAAIRRLVATRGRAKCWAWWASSGSGKTTLLNCLAGRLTPEPGVRSSTIRRPLWSGRRAWPLRSTAPAAVAHRMGLVNQDARDGLRMAVSAGANIGERLMAVGARHYGDIRRSAADWLGRVEIEQDRLDDRPTTYSGGMRQRLQIARNLVSEPRLVFMDEPTGGLDVSVQARILDLLRGLVGTLNLSAVLVTHDLGVARLLTHRLMVMQGGRVVEDGLTDQVLDDPQHAYTQMLVASILPV